MSAHDEVIEHWYEVQPYDASEDTFDRGPTFDTLTQAIKVKPPGGRIVETIVRVVYDDGD
jgi:hypothetical protein